MKKTTFLLFLICIMGYSQSKVLVFHKTNGFRHNSINAGINMITNQGTANGLWTTDDSQNSNVFTATNLAQYDAVIWLNTSGNNLLTAAQRTAFENFIISGGGFVGVHAATDTYRNGSWPFYNELVGGIVQTSPNHTANNFNATMTVLDGHPSVGFLGSSWNKSEEYYYWQNNGGQLSTDNTVLLEVESTGGNSYDAARPIAWYKEAITVGGTTYTNLRSIYTALGHNANDYNNDSDFQMHVEEAVKWAIGSNVLSVPELASPAVDFESYPNPAKDTMTLDFKTLTEDAIVNVHNVIGKLALKKTVKTSDLSQGRYALDVSQLETGIYLLSVKTKTATKTIKLVKL